MKTNYIPLTTLRPCVSWLFHSIRKDSTSFLKLTIYVRVHFWWIFPFPITERKSLVNGLVVKAIPSGPPIPCQFISTVQIFNFRKWYILHNFNGYRHFISWALRKIDWFFRPYNFTSFLHRCSHEIHDIWHYSFFHTFFSNKFLYFYNAYNSFLIKNKKHLNTFRTNITMCLWPNFRFHIVNDILLAITIS